MVAEMDGDGWMKIEMDGDEDGKWEMGNSGYIYIYLKGGFQDIISSDHFFGLSQPG